MSERTTMPPRELRPTALEGRVVRLEPLRAEHVGALWKAARFPELWELALARMGERGEMQAYVDEALATAAKGTVLPFVTMLRATGEIVGSTRFAAYEPAHRRVEIGWTWITPAHQRTSVNTEAKLLMFQQAFDVWGLQRVELKTDALNARSRNAMLRLGLTEEGTMRRHMLTASGRVRDSVYFSVIREEWPAVRDRIERLLARAPVPDVESAR